MISGGFTNENNFFSFPLTPVNSKTALVKKVFSQKDKSVKIKYSLILINVNFTLNREILTTFIE